MFQREVYPYHYRYPNFLTTQSRTGQLPCQNHLDQSNRFDKTPTSDRLLDRQTHCHSTALVERHAGKDSRLQMTSQFIFVSRLLQNYLLRLCLYRLFRLIAPGVNDKPEQYSNNRYKKLAGLLRAMNSKEPIGVATCIVMDGSF